MPILTQNSKVLTAAGKVLIREATPLDLPNLKLYLSATRMPQYADGTAISSFLDYSGNNYNATQATGSLQPTFQTNEFGINAGIKYDGSDDRTSITGSALDIFRNINQYTVQIASKRNVVSDSCNDFYVTTNSNSTVRFAFAWVGANAQLVVRRLDADASIIITAPSNDTNPHLIQITLNPSNYTVYMYIDGVLVNSAQLASSGSMNNTASSQINVGWYNITPIYGKSCINGISVNTSYSDNATIQAQYRGYLQRGYL